MGKNSDILHNGIVTNIEGNAISVLLRQETACAGCHAAGSCSVYGNDTKTIKVEGEYSVTEGQEVTVSISESQGFTALFLGYVLPLIIMVICLVLCISLSAGELASGLISLGILVPYYVVLFILRPVISRKFSFKLLTKGKDEYNSASDNYQS